MDEEGNPFSYTALCMGVTHNGAVYVRDHFYTDTELHLFGSDSLCPSCLELKRSLKKLTKEK